MHCLQIETDRKIKRIVNTSGYLGYSFFKEYFYLH